MTSDRTAGIAARTASAEVDLAAFRRNVRRLHDHVGDVSIMVVVKADGYGHGMINCAAAARAAGAAWVGTATPTEALALRASGDRGRLLCWLYGPDEDLEPVVAADIDLTVHSPEQLASVVAAAAAIKTTARVQLKVDTGLSRNGSPMRDWPDLCAEAADAERAGAVAVTGIWSHFAAADEPGHPSVARQQQAFAEALTVSQQAGLTPEVRHLANSAGAITLPEARYDLVRLGIGCYGIEPVPGQAVAAGLELEPVMTLRAQLVNVKPLAAGEGVSYGHTWIADHDTVVGLVPLGYGDGIPVHASNRAEVQVGGRRAPIRGRVCMDQFVVDLGPDAEDQIGDEVIIFSGADRGPTAQDWAQACDTIGYEIVTRIGARVPRRIVADHDHDPQAGNR
ncbi:alanine racemase [Microlunatus elymi]|uniref:Alanine racemase n=1 Tax=Microlunatus elymi TaxID=2596828 RepID=A0A516PWN5_9ACTN|nr:alanine racemase [Microlunatus elymi]QDP95593.1 alanine racemase [Microlunatus elymi]